jgi:hypothetical protein
MQVEAKMAQYRVRQPFHGVAAGTCACHYRLDGNLSTTDAIVLDVAKNPDGDGGTIGG